MYFPLTDIQKNYHSKHVWDPRNIRYNLQSMASHPFAFFTENGVNVYRAAENEVSQGGAEYGGENQVCLP
jgi:hypothetical protein